MRGLKPIRLPQYDYRTNGYYFVTIISRNRKNIFQNSKTVIEEELESITKQTRGLSVDTRTYPKNPFRLCKPQFRAAGLRLGLKISEIFFVLRLAPRSEIVSFGSKAIFRIDSKIIMSNHVHLILFLENCELSLGEIVRRLKAKISHTFGYSVWQPNYYEHVIRDEAALNRIREYIIHNPELEILKFEQFYPRDADPPALVPPWRDGAGESAGYNI